MRSLISLFRCTGLPLMFLLALVPAVGRAQEGKRIALIIGNNNYALAPLRNAVNDARLMDQALKSAGFITIPDYDVTKAGLEEDLAKFMQLLGPDDTALFYYAGHGIQIENENYLIPVDFAPDSSVIQAKYRTWPMGPVLEGLKNRPKRAIVILDACRTNPVAKSHALEGGLAQPPDVGQGIYFAYSTQPGHVAADNPDGRNSWFTEALADQIAQKGLELGEVFRRVRARVLSETAGKQVTWSTDTALSKFFFYPPADIESSVDPTFAEKWMSDARLREQRQEWAEAIRLVEQVLQKKPGAALETMAANKLPYLKARNEAQIRYEASDFAAAAALDERALQLDPFALDAAFQGANAYLLADRLPDAVRVLQQVRMRGTTVSLDKATAMLKELSSVEPAAGKTLQAGIPQPPPIEEVLSGTRFHVPDFELGDRYLMSTPVTLNRWGKELTAAITPPAPPPPPPAPAASAAQQLAALSEAELKVAQAFLHVEIVPSQDTRDIGIRRIGGTNGAAAASGFVQLDGPQTQTLVLMDGRPLARQVPARVSLPPGKYEIRTVEGANILSRESIEITPASVSSVMVRSKQ